MLYIPLGAFSFVGFPITEYQRQNHQQALPFFPPKLFSLLSPIPFDLCLPRLPS
jgi:hypothetical protein